MNKKDLPKRKRIRLIDFDYSETGYYYLTICTKEKQKTLSKIVGVGFPDDPKVELTEIGKTVENAIKFIDETNQFVNIETYCIMPNHIHLIVFINNESANGSSGKPTPTNAILSKVVSSLKRYTNRKTNKKLWQRSFYEHVIRNEKSLIEISEYIHNNPAVWESDSLFC